VRKLSLKAAFTHTGIEGGACSFYQLGFRIMPQFDSSGTL